MNPRPPIIGVVDDDQRVLESLQNLLESADYTVRLYSSARALLDSGYFHEIDCLISDIHMPMINGLELLRLVHDSRPELPIIFVTGHAEILKESPLIDPGLFRLLTKPFEGQELLTAVSEALRSSWQPTPES